MLFFFILGSLLLTACHTAPIEDKIISLPLYGPPPTAHFSGYLNGTNGCDTSVNGECYLHYWFAAGEGSCCEPKPTVLWLNGGPGSSSILGFLQELGPLLMNATGGLMNNPYAWTKVANVLVLESPIGVGYSYCTAQANGGTCQNTDKFTASTARAALVDFFTNKFPELVPNDFYITGESYAGIYVPTLAYEVLTNAKNEIPNLKGVAVGDPCTDNEAQAIAFNPLWYGHKYGLVDDAIYDTLWNKCSVRLSFTVTMNKSRMKEQLESKFQQLRKMKYPITAKQDDVACRIAYRKFIMSTSGGLSQGWKDMYIDDYSLFAPVTDAEDEAMAVYMNRPDVRSALHVERTPGVTNWPGADHGFDYTSEYFACNDSPSASDALSMIDFYRKLAPALERTWIYNGDTDPCVTYEGTRTAIKRVGFPELDGGGYRPWFYNQTAASIEVIQEKATMFGPNLVLQNVGAQFGGEIVNYEHNLAFFTVHGSGHMVPQFRPQAALHFLTKLVTGAELLSPLLPLNQTLATLGEDDFQNVLSQWTEDAKKAPFVV